MGAWLGEKTWEGVKWLGEKTWEVLKAIGNWIKDHPFETVLIVLAILLLGPIAIHLIQASISATGASGFFS